MCPSVLLCSPYERAAAVGSLIILKTSNPAIAPASFVSLLCISLKYAGTVITAFLMGTFSCFSAIAFIFSRTIALICSGKNSVSLPSPTSTQTIGFFPLPSLTLNGIRFKSELQSPYSLPIIRLILNRVLFGFFAACLLAPSPTIRPSSVKATQLGVVRDPSSLGRISTPPLRHTPTQEYVVPKSMPTTISPEAEPAPLFVSSPPGIFFLDFFSRLASASGFEFVF
mmetsp:Transcript_3630/g.5589  ORF Transcript_3630/g.5589 Transcript_3630/m.5589 type:complete len:226 (+) Transcript_3630:1134-1811(+)